MTKEQIATALKSCSKVTYDGAEYGLLGFFMYCDKITKTLKYSAELEDKNGRTVVRAPLEKVEML